MDGQFSRTAALLGEAALARLAGARVAVFGVGGVGGYAVEALARSGVGALELIDPDRVCASNLNRQLVALHSTLGRYKVDVAAERVRDINPACDVTTRRCFFTPRTADAFDFARYDCVADAIDTVAGKAELIARTRAAGVPIVCAMGAGNKLDPARLEAAWLRDTAVCPLARAVRRACRGLDVDGVRVVYSREAPAPGLGPAPLDDAGRRPPASSPFVPAAAGIILAAEVVRAVLGEMGGGRGRRTED